MTFETDELLALAAVDIERGALADGLAKLKQVLAGAAVPAAAYAMAARLYAQLHLFGRAKELFRKYVELHPEAELELFQFGMTCYDNGQGDEALGIWERVLKNHPTHPPALFFKALVLAQQARPADARQSLNVLLQSAPPDNLYFGRGRELLQAMDAGQGAGAGVAGAGGHHVLSRDAYKKAEH